MLPDAFYFLFVALFFWARLLCSVHQSEEGWGAVLPAPTDEDEDARVARDMKALEAEVELEYQTSKASADRSFQADVWGGDLARHAVQMADQVQRESSGVLDEEDIVIHEALPQSMGMANIPLSSNPTPIAPYDDGLPEGLLFFDGRDSLGRPVIVLCTAAMPPTSGGRKEVLVKMKDILTPVVEEDYVLLLITDSDKGSSNYSPVYLLSSFRALGRSFRKNVKWVIFHRPTYFVRTVLYMAKAFISSKATKKWRNVSALKDIGNHTNGEVTFEHLGSAAPYVKDL